MTCALIAFIVEAITIFLQYRTVTRISAENKQNLEFPAVTICNMNMVKKTIPQCNGTVFANLDKVFLNFGETLVIEDRLTPGLGFVNGLLPSGEQMLNCSVFEHDWRDAADLHVEWRLRTLFKFVQNYPDRDGRLLHF